MKGSFTILCFALIFGILAGCTGTSTVSTSKGTISTETIDPFVGSWTYTSSSGTTSIYRFTQSGQYFYTEQNYKEQLWGNWIKTGDNTYRAILWANKSTTNEASAVLLTYDQNTDTIYDISGSRLYRIKDTTTIATQNSICEEWSACGFGYGNFEGEPAGLSKRCHELYEMRMQNDQRVLACLKNPYEAKAAASREVLQCYQGMGTLEYCYGIADKNGISRDMMKESWCETNSAYVCYKTWIPGY